jgi:hypothetical protein
MPYQLSVVHMVIYTLSYVSYVGHKILNGRKIFVVVYTHNISPRNDLNSNYISNTNEALEISAFISVLQIYHLADNTGLTIFASWAEFDSYPRVDWI